VLDIKKFDNDQFCLDFYRALQPFVVSENLPHYIDDVCYLVGKRTGIEIIRYPAGKLDASFQFKCTYTSIEKLTNFGDTHTPVNPVLVYPVVKIICREEIKAPFDQILPL